MALANGANVAVLGTFPFMQRYVDYRYDKLEDAGGADGRGIEAYLRRLRSQIASTNADFVIVSAASLKGRPPELLDAGESAPFLEPLLRDDGVVVYRIVKAGR